MLLLLYFVPATLAVAVHWFGEDRPMKWWQARTDSSGQAPDPRVERQAVVQVYAARAFGLRGALGVHTWIATKRTGARRYLRYEVIGWGVRRGRPAVRAHPGVPDAHWYGRRPELLWEARGAGVDEVIARIESAAEAYPYADVYRVWPGPNSNTFTAHIVRSVPELELALPAIAVGKDYPAGGGWLLPAPSGSGYQFSVWGYAGVMLALDEGIELNLGGLVFGLDLLRPAIKLPGFGRVGMSRDRGPRATAAAAIEAD